jgi:hypothetical protein
MKKKRNYWTREKAFEMALMFNSKRDFKKKYIAGYELLRKNGWLDEACIHMTNIAHPIKWTYDKCKNEALKYESKKEFERKCSWGYRVARKNGWLDNITQHYEKPKRKIFWTKERCQTEANNYNKRIDFIKKSKAAYSACARNGWVDDVCSHMKNKHETRYKWTKEKCQKIALKYGYRKEFQQNDKNAYYSAMYNGWLNEICEHMRWKKLPNKHWHLLENCKNEALKYKTKTDFIKKSQHVYNISRKNGWLDEICEHMIPRGDKYHRCIYVYEFSDNSAYVGLTNDLERRKLDRKRDINDAVSIHISKTKNNTEDNKINRISPNRGSNRKRKVLSR